ncbi:Na-translocating system protein MpsC family protein [Robertmurraya massiliosenegalensis]|uniref:Na-translocating system protein MpsC family protein n=1 Tax=Robertmurraya TaxID=2837507 RepID=UPI0039A4CF58
MPFCKLQAYAKPGINKPLLFDEIKRKKIQHKIANYWKQCGKEKFDKGPDGTRVTIVDDLVIIRTERYLTKMERFVIDNESDGAEYIRSLRVNVLDGAIQEGELISTIEKMVEATAIYCIHDSYPSDEYCVMIIVFDRQLA